MGGVRIRRDWKTRFCLEENAPILSRVRAWLTKREGTAWAVALDMALDLVSPKDLFIFPDLTKHSMNATKCLDHFGGLVSIAPTSR